MPAKRKEDARQALLCGVERATRHEQLGAQRSHVHPTVGAVGVPSRVRRVVDGNSRLATCARAGQSVAFGQSGAHVRADGMMLDLSNNGLPNLSPSDCPLHPQRGNRDE